MTHISPGVTPSARLPWGTFRVRGNESGYRLVSVRDNKIFTLSFVDRSLSGSEPFVDKGTVVAGSVSPDGTEVAVSLCLAPGMTHPKPNVSDCPSGFVLAIARIDGSDLRKYPELAAGGIGICWSHDMSKLALNMVDRRLGQYSKLQILDLKSGLTEVIADGIDAFVDSQCWSSDDKQIVYTVNKPMGIRIVRLYETQTKRSKDIAGGGHPTWSPDGNWIAFLFCPPSLRDCTYFGIRVSTSRQELLFKADGESGLFWSPDSRFVAYISAASSSERNPSEQMREMLRLRVRRLEDNAEYSCTDFFDGDIMWFDWVR
jgi:hypothetical protein